MGPNPSGDRVHFLPFLPSPALSPTIRLPFPYQSRSGPSLLSPQPCALEEGPLIPVPTPQVCLFQRRQLGERKRVQSPNIRIRVLLPPVTCHVTLGNSKSPLWTSFSFYLFLKLAFALTNSDCSKEQKENDSHAPGQTTTLRRSGWSSASWRPGPVFPQPPVRPPQLQAVSVTFSACPLPATSELTCRQAPPKAVAGNRRLKETPTTAAMLAPDVQHHP